MAFTKKQMESAQKKLKEIQKKYPVGIYDSKEQHTVKVLRHRIEEINGEIYGVTELYYTNNPNYGKSEWGTFFITKNKAVGKYFLDEGKYKRRK